jgi:rare lipoprotein A
MLPGPGGAVPVDAVRKPGAFYLDDGPGDGPPVDPAAVPDAVPQDEAPRPNANRPYEALGEVYFPDTSSLPFSDRGLASWYGRRFHGRRTSSGEPYDMYAMTAAHKTLPIPSYARVTDVLTGKSVVVRVNDRGPFHTGRVIDLSYTAAAKLGYASRGSAEVLVERVFPAGIGDLPLDQVDATAAAPAPPLATTGAASTAGATMAAASASASASASATPTPTPTPTAASTAAAPAGPPRSRVAADEAAFGQAPAIAPPPAAVPAGNPSLGSDTASARGGWFLQLGAFRDTANARHLLERARAVLNGLEHFLRLDEGNGVSRVRLGPFPSAAEQNKAASAVERALHLRPGLVGP